MSCIKNDLIQKYNDGEATPKEIALIEKHIVNCEKCALKFDDQQRLAAGVKKAINLLAEDTIEIPKIVTSTSHSKKRFFTGKRLIYSISAACIVLFVLFITQNKEPEIENEIIITYSLDWDYDANRTISQQQMVINIIDPEGYITEYFIE